MKYWTICFLLLTVSCKTLQDLDYYGTRKTQDENQRLKDEDGKKRLAEELARKKEKEEERLALFPKSLQNTINLKVGQSTNDVVQTLRHPNSVSATRKETIWHYLLWEYPTSEARLIPFIVAFSKDKVVRFGINQEQIERDRAKVIIQKDVATTDKDK